MVTLVVVFKFQTHLAMGHLSTTTVEDGECHRSPELYYLTMNIFIQVRS